MRWKYLGKITVASAGTPVQITSINKLVQAILFGQVEANTGKIWICDRSNAVKSTGVGILDTLAKPTLESTVATSLPKTTVSVPGQMKGFDLADFWIDADVNGESCQVSYLDSE